MGRGFGHQKTILPKSGWAKTCHCHKRFRMLVPVAICKFGESRPRETATSAAEMSLDNDGADNVQLARFLPLVDNIERKVLRWKKQKSQ